MAKTKRKKYRIKKQEDKNFKTLIFILLLCIAVYIALFITSVQYEFINGGNLPFLLLALIAGVATGVLITFLWLRKFLKVGQLIGSCLMISFFAALLFYSLSVHTNFIFDPTPIQRYSVTIEEKERDRHRKWTEYEFTFTIDGKQLDLNVSPLEYAKYKTGDTYIVNYHQGAFGVPFYRSGAEYNGNDDHRKQNH